MIALPRPLDELSLVHGRLDCITTLAVVFDRVWRPATGNRSGSPAGPADVARVQRLIEV